MGIQTSVVAAVMVCCVLSAHAGPAIDASQQTILPLRESSIFNAGYRETQLSKFRDFPTFEKHEGYSVVLDRSIDEYFGVYQLAGSDLGYFYSGLNGQEPALSGTLFFHPGPNTEVASLQIIPSFTGLSNIKGEFRSGIGATTGVLILVNDQAVFSSTINNEGTVSQFDFDFNADIHDVVEIQVSDGGNGYFSDATALSVAILVVSSGPITNVTSVPEPSSLLSVAVALMFVCIGRKPFMSV